MKRALYAARWPAEGQFPHLLPGGGPECQWREPNGIARRKPGLGHQHRPGGLKSSVVKLLHRTVLMLGTELKSAFSCNLRRMGRLLSRVRVGMKSQNPRLWQQRPRKAEQQQQGYMRT